MPNLKLNSREVKPRKSDIQVDRVSLVWLPYRVDDRGGAEPVYEIPSANTDTIPDGRDEQAAELS